MEHCWQKICSPGKKFGFLIDPDKHTVHSLLAAVYAANEARVDFILVGGSLVSDKIDAAIEIIKKNSEIPVILFPGSIMQLNNKADAILYLSLISGRNPDYLIGNHVLSSMYIKKSGMECLPTGYILIEGGSTSSTEYISNTRPIPRNKSDIVIATAVAGELLGNKLIYLETGSGAKLSVPPDIVYKVKQNIEIPIIVGGGLRDPNQIKEVLDAGADMVVIGNSLEKNLQQLSKMVEIVNYR